MTSAPIWSLVQLTDLHLVGSGRLVADVIDTAAFLEQAVSTVASLSLRPDLVLLTGDLVDDGGAAGYRQLVELLAPIAAPVVLLPGNHDDLDTMRDAFAAGDPSRLVPGAEANASGRADIVIDGPVTVVGLDSTRGPDPSGHLDPVQLDWLDSVLGSWADRPAIVALHHPPISTGLNIMDTMRLTPSDAAALANVIGRHHHVERVCCGHDHRAITARWAGTVLSVSPGTAHAVALDLDRPLAAWTLEPPALSLHIWSPQLGLVSHLVPTGDFPATPY